VRTLHAVVGELRVAPRSDDGGNLLLEFFLPRGAYATVVLREYMKAEPMSMC